MKANALQHRAVSMPTANEFLAFGLELAGFAAVSVWGWQRAGWIGAVILPLALSTMWGTFLSPRASRPVTGAAWPLAKLLVFAGFAVTLAAVAGFWLAAVFFALALLSVILGGTR